MNLQSAFLRALLLLTAADPVLGQLTAVATPSPSAPSPSDMVTITITMIGSRFFADVPLSYSLDGSPSAIAPLSGEDTANISLGQLSAGTHTLMYSFPGDQIYQPASWTYSFQVSATPFTYLGSSVMILYNTGDEGHVAIDSRDNSYFSNRSQNVIHKRDTHSNLTTVPTSGLNTPQGIAFDASDNLYIADQGNSRIVRVSNGVQTTLPISTSAPLNLTFDNTRQNLYITDTTQQAILVFNLATSATTVFKGNLYNIFDVTFDPSGNLYYSQRYSYSPGTLTKVIAGVATVVQTPINSPGGLAFDTAGNLYMTDFGSGGTWRMTPAGHFQQMTEIGDEALALDSRGVIYLPGINSYAYSSHAGAFTGQSLAFPGGGGGDLAQLTPTVYYSSSATEWLSSIAFPTSNSPFRTYANVTCLGNRLCYESFANNFVHPGPQSDYVVATSNLGTQLSNPVYGIGINSEVGFSPGVVSQRQTIGGTFGSFTFLSNGDILGTSPDYNRIYANHITESFIQKDYQVVSENGTAQAATQIAGDAQRNIYYLESGTSRILRGSAGVLAVIDQVAPDPTFNATVVFDLATQPALHTLTAFALDGGSNLWIAGADVNGNGTILLQDSIGNSKVFATGIGVPVAMTVDEFGLLYSVDAAGTLRTFDKVGNSTILASTLSSPRSLAVEPSGVVYLASGVGDLMEVKPDGSFATVPISGVTNAAFVTFDNLGNLAVGDNKTSQIFVVDRSQPQSFAFGNVAVNSVSTVFHSQLLNIGNQNLSFSQLPGGDATFTASACTTGTVLAPGGACDLNFTFHPAALQTYTETEYIVDSTGGASAAASQFSLPFSGTGVLATPLITLTSNFPGIGISVDGGAVQAAPFTVALGTGNHVITAVATQAGGTGTQYAFSGWSDGGALSHSITVGTAAATYTATFKTQYLLVTVASPTGGGSLTPTQYFDAGSIVPVTATPTPGYIFAGFSGAITGSTNPGTLTMTAPARVVANFTPLAPSLTASVGARTDIVAGVSRQVTLYLNNTGVGVASHPVITSVTATVVLGTGAVTVTSGVPVNMNYMLPGASSSTTVNFNWPTTATKVKLTVSYSADGGYAGTSTITTLR